MNFSISYLDFFFGSWVIITGLLAKDYLDERERKIVCAREKDTSADKIALLIAEPVGAVGFKKLIGVVRAFEKNCLTTRGAN